MFHVHLLRSTAKAYSVVRGLIFLGDGELADCRRTSPAVHVGDFPGDFPALKVRQLAVKTIPKIERSTVGVRLFSRFLTGLYFHGVTTVG